MNSSQPRAVQARRAAARIAVATIVWLGINASCTDVSGGAVELSWLLRPSNGDEGACSEQSCCQTSQVERMRLMWDVGGTTGSDAWQCEDNRAVTGFVLPPGEAALWVVPECADQPASTMAYEAPAPVVRTLVTGDVVSLNAVVVQVQIADCGPQACICRTP